MNTAKVTAALNTLSLGLAELAEALGPSNLLERIEQAPKTTTVAAATAAEFPPFEPEYEPLPFTSDQVESAALGRCPAHDRPWTVKAAGVSKAGKAYNAFWKCDGKDADGNYCNRKPVKAWADSHPADRAA